ALLYETLLYETLRERQAQGIALRVACFHEVVRQGSVTTPTASITVSSSASVTLSLSKGSG
ncbi:hypothetical protein, partial [Nostoc sp. NMS7]|uniref:hypothetical protein n=1 Tax=Nostoc sp. NMS7 TaxID=2815391 RepID=UPI0025FE7F96